jgi:hypothetical protein
MDKGVMMALVRGVLDLPLTPRAQRRRNKQVEKAQRLREIWAQKQERYRAKYAKPRG